MRLASVAHGGRIRAGVVADGGAIVPLGDDMPAVIRGWIESPGHVRAAAAAVPASERLDRSAVMLAAPVPRPGKIVCLAGNYREHIVESGFARVNSDEMITPQMFLKPSTCLTADGADVPLARRNASVGWEVELAVVIGAGGRDISEADAMRHVFGYTILNDLSERAVNRDIPGRRVRERDPFFDWLAGKWFDGFAPCGPWIVTADEIPDPHALDLRLSVNGTVRQQGNTRDMIFKIPRLIAEISSISTLEPGDLIATGTPAGAGTGFGDAVLHEGDDVRCEIEGIGTLQTRIGQRR